MLLPEAAHNKELIVQDLTCTGTARQRLMDFGIFKGTHITLKGAAPLGDPFIVGINNSTVAIRKEDAQKIIVTKGEDI